MEYSLSLQMSSTESTGEGTRGQPKAQHLPPHQSLYRVRKPPAKPWRRPDLPQPPRVYRVNPHGFRTLVQRLTGKPQSSTTAQVTAAPVPVAQQPPVLPQSLQQEPAVLTSEMNQMGLMSPSFYSSWCSFPLLSPRSMAALES